MGEPPLGALLVLVAAMGATGAALPPVRRWLLARGMLDLPNARSSHRVPVARGAGIGCAVGVLIGLTVAAVIGREVPWGLAAVAAMLCAVGLVDDVASLPVGPRLGLQLAAGGCAGWLAGGTALVGLGVLVMVLLVNVVNFMDGVNGISGLVALVWGGFAVLAGARADSAALVTVGLVTSGAALGFLPFNVPRARLFLGDSGSYLLGALMAAGLLLAVRDHAALALVLGPLAVYLADVLSTLLRRLLARRPLLQAHRDHVYQRLVAPGRGHLQVAVLVAALSAVLAATWLAPAVLAVPVTVLLLGGYLLAPHWLGRSSALSRLGGWST